MTLFDWIVLIVLALSVIMAASQGLLLEIFSLVGLVVGLALAFWNYHVLAVPFTRVMHAEHLADVLAFLLIALGVMILAGLAGRIVSKLAHVAGLGGLDRLMGAVFGLVRGCALVVVAIIAIAAFMPGHTWMNGSKFAPYFLPVANRCSAAAPAELRLKIQQGVADLEQASSNWLHLDLHRHPATR